MKGKDLRKPRPLRYPYTVNPDGLTVGEKFVPFTEMGGRQPESTSPGTPVPGCSNSWCFGAMVRI
jgi:hypothetical protein